MVTVWIEKVRRIVEAFLASEEDFYITTEGDLKLEIISSDDWTEQTKQTTIFTEEVKQESTYILKIKS